MHAIISLLVGLALLDIISAHAAIPRTPSSRPMYKHTQRDEPIPTFRAGPITEYFPQASQATPTGSAVVLYPEGIVEDLPPEGIDIMFGPEVMQKIEAVKRDNCTNNNGGQCYSAITKALDETNVGLQARRITPLKTVKFSALGAVISIIWMWWELKLAKTQPPNLVHLPLSALDQISSLSTASQLAFETGADDANKVTATLTDAPSPTAKDYPTVTTLSSDTDGHQQGDVLITIPEDLSRRLEDFINQISNPETDATCQASSRKKRVPGADCIQAIIERAALVVENGQAAFDHLWNENPIQVPVRRDLEVANRAVFRRARAVGALAHLNNPQLLDLVTTAVNAVAAVLINHLTSVHVIVIVKVDVTPVKDDNYACPTDKPVCSDQECQGDDESGVCKTGDPIGCECIVISKVWYHPGSPEDLDSQQAFIRELAGASEAMELQPKCNNKDRVDVESSWWDEEVGSMCKTLQSMKRENSKEVEAHGYKWKFGWEHKGNCMLSCEDVFATFSRSTYCEATYTSLPNRDTVFDIRAGHYNQHAMASSGSVESSCGAATFSISKSPEEAPPSPPENTNFRLDIHQEMVYRDSFVEWTLYATSDGSKISGPSRSGKIEGASYDLTLLVINPTNKDDVDIKFTRNWDTSSIIWSTGTTRKKYKDGNPPAGASGFPKNYCVMLDERASWIPNGAGFKRDITCYFVRDP